MSYSLPAATQTRKVNSLPGDLKEIVNELIKNKFKVEEEVVFNPGDPFRGYQGNVYQSDRNLVEPQMDTRYRNWPVSSYSLESRDVRLDQVYAMVKRVERETGITNFRGRAQFIMGRGEFDDIMHDMRSSGAVQFGPIKLFGIDVALVGGRTNRITLEAWR